MAVFFYCKHCGNMFAAVNASGVNPVCCGENMTQLEAQFSDTGSEKHVPAVNASEDRVEVTVGEYPHPMTAEHAIQWIALETSMGIYVKHLSIESGKAQATFLIGSDENPLAVYAYCNIHGLWVKEI